MGYFVPDDQPVIWRGPMLHKAIQQFLTDAYWGEPDFVLVDMPPGTGDVALTLAEVMPRAEIVVVTTPQPAAQRVAQRSAFAARRLKLSVRGVIENMSWFTGDDGKRYELFGAGRRRHAGGRPRRAAARPGAARQRRAARGRRGAPGHRGRPRQRDGPGVPDDRGQAGRAGPAHGLPAGAHAELSSPSDWVQIDQVGTRCDCFAAGFARFPRCTPSHHRMRRTFIAFLFEGLAILASVCFHDDSNASTEEVHMRIHSTNHQMPMLCAAAAAGNRALLG